MLAIGLKDFDFLKALRVQVFIYLCFHYFVMRFKIGFLFLGDGFLYLGGRVDSGVVWGFWGLV